MKSLKIEHKTAKSIISGEKTSVWRLFDDKDIVVGDRLEIIAKVEPSNRDSWQTIGVITVQEITNKALGSVTKTDLQQEGLKDQDEMYKIYRTYYGNNVDADDIVKIITFRFEPYSDNKAYVNGPIKVEEVKLFADGGSRGNPGPSASGFVLLDMNDQIIEKNGIYLGVTTNNQAEYRALKLGLEAAKQHGVKIVHVYLDSLLVVNQMKGIFKVKNRELWPVHQSIQSLVETFESVDFTHVLREYNKQADEMVNETLDAQVTEK